MVKIPPFPENDLPSKDILNFKTKNCYLVKGTELSENAAVLHSPRQSKSFPYATFARWISIFQFCSTNFRISFLLRFFYISFFLNIKIYFTFSLTPSKLFLNKSPCKNTETKQEKQIFEHLLTMLFNSSYFLLEINIFFEMQQQLKSFRISIFQPILILLKKCR